jgi:hypothetical protein
MKAFRPRSFKFKAWNQEEKLLMKLSQIDFNKGELYKRNHILLQFTGLHDKHEQEIYEMDILLVSDQRYIVRWHEENNGWYVLPYPEQDSFTPLRKEKAITMKRLCNAFESEGK